MASTKKTADEGTQTESETPTVDETTSTTTPEPEVETPKPSKRGGQILAITGPPFTDSFRCEVNDTVYEVTTAGDEVPNASVAKEIIEIATVLGITIERIDNKES